MLRNEADGITRYQHGFRQQGNRHQPAVGWRGLHRGGGAGADAVAGSVLACGGFVRGAGIVMHASTLHHDVGRTGMECLHRHAAHAG